MSKRFLLLSSCLSLTVALPASAHQGEERFVYVGTYTAPAVPPGGTHPSTAVGIYVFRMNTDGNLTPVQTLPVSNPSYLAVDASHSHLYSVNEDTAGRVSSFRIAADGTLSFVNSADANGSFTTHIGLHPSGKFVYAANYGTGNFPVFALNADGSLGAKTDDFQSVGNGTGPNPLRQEGPHAHQMIADLTGGHVFGVDLGSDKVNALVLDVTSGKLSPNTVPFVPVASGSGPRHMAFHPDQHHAYVLDEMASSITVFSYDATRGAFVWLQTLSTLPSGFTGGNTTAEIRIHPSGRFLYNTNRGHDSVTMYEVEPTSGQLTVMGWESTHGQWPRGMNIDPSGTFLYAANENTDDTGVFHIRPNGRLRFVTLVCTPTPVDVEFGAAP